jgi:hypothetical protein
MGSANEVQRAPSFLPQIEEWNDSGVLDRRPPVITYNLFFPAWRAYNRGLSEESARLWQHMEERGIRPNAVSYIRHNHERLGQFELLMGSMKARPDVMTYSTWWLKSIAVSSLSDRMD